MSEHNQKILEDLLVVEVLVLAGQLKAAKQADGIHSTSDYTREAVQLIRQKRRTILDLLRET